MQEKNPAANAFCQCMTFLWAGQPQLTQYGERNQRQRVQSAPHSLDLTTLQPKLVPPPSLSAWFQGIPGAADKDATGIAGSQPPAPREGTLGWGLPAISAAASVTFPAPSTGCVLERAAADYHRASHVRGMCWKEHYSSQTPTAPCLKLKAHSNP